MTCGELLLKSAGSTFTGYFLIVSVAFILYGLSSAYYLLKINSVESLEQEHVAVPSLCLVLFGVLLFILVIIGCCAICREIPCCLEAYAVLLTMLAVAQIGVSIFCLTQFKYSNYQFRERISNDINKMFFMYEENPKQMDDTQQWMSCCGVESPTDWIIHYNRSYLPASCCEDLNLGCGITTSASNKFDEGCSTMVFAYIVSTNYIIGWSLVVVGITEIVGAMMGISLSCAFWRNSRILWI